MVPAPGRRHHGPDIIVILLWMSVVASTNQKSTALGTLPYQDGS